MQIKQTFSSAVGLLYLLQFFYIEIRYATVRYIMHIKQNIALKKIMLKFSFKMEEQDYTFVSIKSQSQISQKLRIMSIRYIII